MLLDFLYELYYDVQIHKHEAYSSFQQELQIPCFQNMGIYISVDQNF